LREWQPVSLQHRAGVVYVAYLVTLGGAGLVFYRRVEPVRWIVLAVFLGLSLRHWRNVPLFLLVSLPLSAEMIAALTQWVHDRVPTIARHPQRWLLATTLAVALTMVRLGPDHLERVAFCGLAPEEFFRDTEYPIEAVEWIRAHRDQIGSRLYNEYGFGGFLRWWLPQEKIFIDGRMPAWRIGHRWIFYDYIALAVWDPPELGVLDKYSVDWAIVARGSTLESALRSRLEWQTVYEDRKVGIHVKRRRGGAG
jgi:hypothetical protein